MQIKCSSMQYMVDEIRTNDKQIIMFGAGVIGQITAFEILKTYNLVKNIHCFLDNDDTKWGRTIQIDGKDYLINSPQYLKELNSKVVILINISRFAEVKLQLEAMECTKDMVAYIMPMMCIHNMCSSISEGIPVFTDMQLIPKKIHYMWFGRKKIPDNLKKCIETWYKFCPDYEIIQWNENNYNIEKNVYMKQAYEAGAYGFIPDYARIDILYNEGGIYMDTDVQLIKGLDDMLYQEAFCGVEKWQILNFGGCSGAVKGHPMIKKFLDERMNVHYMNPDGTLNRNTCGFYDTRTAIKEGYKVNGSTQSINGMNIFAFDYFHPYDYMSGMCSITKHTYSIHHFDGGWMDTTMKAQNKITSTKYMKLYRECLGK